MRYYTVEGVSKYHKVHKATARRWIFAGLLPHIDHEAQMLVPEDEVIAFVKPKAGRPPGPKQDRRNWSFNKVPEEDWEAIAEEYATTKVSLQEIGNRYQVTRERIRQIIKEIDPEARKKHRAVTESLRLSKDFKSLNEKLMAQMQYALDNDVHCVVCGAWVIRRSHKPNTVYHTCSPEHAVAWPIIRTAMDPEGHRKFLAMSIINHPEASGKAPSKKAWAEAILSDNPPPKNRSYIVPGSKRAKLIQEYLPDTYRMLTHKCPTPKCHSTCVHHLHSEINWNNWMCLRCDVDFDA